MSCDDQPPLKKRFKVISDEELKQKRKEQENQNTINSEKRADKAFKSFLTECGCESNEYYFFEERELCTWLSKFWFGARTVPDKNEQEGEMYSVNTMRNFKYALNRILKKYGHAYDITKSPEFKPAMDAFDDAMKELKENGKGHVNSAEEISEDGKHKMFLFNIFCH